MGSLTSKPKENEEPGESFTEVEAIALLQEELGIEQERAEKLVKKFDSNKDGMVAENEVKRFSKHIKEKKEELKKLFAKFDKDDSGDVSPEEGLEGLKTIFPNAHERTLKCLVKYFDKDKNGKIQYEEFIHFYAYVSSKIEFLADEFMRLDTDKDGSLSLKECQKLLEDECGFLPFYAYALFEEFDANDDDKLNKQEFEDMCLSLFS